MLFRRGLLQLLSLTPCVSAFYPYLREPGNGTDDFEQVEERSTRHGERSSGQTDRVTVDIPTLTLNRRRSAPHALDPSPRSLQARTNTYPVDAAAQPTQANSLAVDEDGTDVSYFSTVKFGSSGKPLRMLLDTGVSRSLFRYRCGI